MRFYIAALALTCTLFAANADPPSDCCCGKNIVGEKYIYEDEAICDGDEPWKLGIKNGIFGIWNGTALFKEYASGADTLWMGGNGEEAFISVYNAGDTSAIWELKCVNQPANYTAKLAMSRDSSHVAKFTKGPNNKLWLAKTDDSDFVGNGCILNDEASAMTPTPSPASGDEPTPSPASADEPTPSPASGDEPTPSPIDVLDTTAGSTWDDDCGANNVCLQPGAQQFNPASDPDKFIQCGAGNTCNLMSCATGTKWDQSLPGCVSKGQRFFLNLLCDLLNLPELCDDGN